MYIANLSLILSKLVVINYFVSIAVVYQKPTQYQHLSCAVGGNSFIFYYNKHKSYDYQRPQYSS